MDFGETLGVIGGVRRKLHYFVMALPHSDAFFLKAYPAEMSDGALLETVALRAGTHGPFDPSGRWLVSEAGSHRAGN